MVTFTDSPTGVFPTFAAFLAARRIVRDAAAEQVVGLRKECVDALRSLEQHFANVAAEATSANGGFIGNLTLSAQLKLREQQERSALKARYDHKITEIYQRYGLDRNGKAVAARDARDYVHAAEAHREDLKENRDAQVDLVLQNMPGARRRRENGWFVYETSVLHGVLPRCELLRCDDRSVVVSGADDDRIRAGLLLAAQRYTPPICITGTPEFVRRSQAIADSLGIPYETGQAVDASPDVAPQTPQQGTNTSENGATTPQQSAEAPTIGKYAVMPSDERLEALKSELGLSFVAALSKPSKQMQEGAAVRRLPRFWDDADGVVVLIGSAAMVVPVDPSLAVELDTQVRIMPAEHGRFVLETVARDRSEPAVEVTHETPDDQLADVVVQTRSPGR